MSECPIILYKLPKFRPKSQTTDVLNVHYKFNTTQASEYVAIFKKLAKSTVEITVLTSELAVGLNNIPSLTFRIQGGPRYTLPNTTTYPHILQYPETFLVLPTITPNTPNTIPNTIFQIWPESVVSQTMGFACTAWIKLNPDYNYITYDSESALQFIKTHFNKYVVRAYQSLERDDCRICLFRYCCLYVHGGIFADIFSVPQVPLYSIIPRNTTLLLTDSQLSYGIGSSIIATAKHNPIFEYIIRNITWNICTKQQMNISQNLVNDAIFGRSCNIYFGKDPNTDCPLTELKSVCRRLYTHATNNSIIDIMQRVILYTTYVNPEVNKLLHQSTHASSDGESADDLLAIGKIPLLSYSLNPPPSAPPSLPSPP